MNRESKEQEVVWGAPENVLKEMDCTGEAASRGCQNGGQCLRRAFKGKRGV